VSATDKKPSATLTPEFRVEGANTDAPILVGPGATDGIDVRDVLKWVHDNRMDLLVALRSKQTHCYACGGDGVICRRDGTVDEGKAKTDDDSDD